MIEKIAGILGKDAPGLLEHQCRTIPKEQIHLPGPDFIDRVWAGSNRKITVLRNLHALYGTGRLCGTGYLSILPVDQGIEHSAGASFAANTAYFDPEQIVRLAIEGGVQCRRLDFRCTWNRGPQIRPQNPFRGKDQPQ